MDPYTVSDYWTAAGVIWQVIVGIPLAAAAIYAVRQIFRPFSDVKRRLDELDQEVGKLKVRDERADRRTEQIRDLSYIQGEALLAVLSHLQDGNSTDKLRGAHDKLQHVLIRKDIN